jgi:hypothetical protein
MKLGRIGNRAFLAAVLALGLAVPAGAGEYEDICVKLGKGDPAGLVEMETFCEKAPSASDAFLALSRGYLNIKKDAALAMDAALRGLEQYDEKWKTKAPKPALYAAFLAAGAISAPTPEMLGRPVARIEKLAKRDAKEAQPALARFDAFRPAKLVPAIVAQVQLLEGRKLLGQALALHDLGVEIARISDLESSLEATLKPGRELAEKGRAELDEALKLEGEKQVEQLKVLAAKYNGHVLGKEAAVKIEELKKPPAERAAAAASFRAKSTKDKSGDELGAEVFGDTLIVTVASPNGTGAAEVSTEKAEWPKKVTLRFNFADLALVQVDNGRKKLIGSLIRGSKDRLIIEKKGKQVEVTLPDGFLAGAADVLKIDWVESYR